VEEVFVDVGEHAGRCLEVVVCGLETGIVGAILVCGMAGKNSRDVENDRGFFECEGVLRGWLVSERIIPSKGDLDMALINRESEVQELKLSVVSIE
jgi:hypothetical protein